jgi:hypothetical protein
MSTQQATQATEPKKSVYEQINNEFVEKQIAMHKDRLRKEAEEKESAKKNKK